jgi:hypothetical protein
MASAKYRGYPIIPLFTTIKDGFKVEHCASEKAYELVPSFSRISY